MTPAVSGRLAACGIQLLADTGRHYLFTRDNFVVLVEQTPAGFGSIGSTGVFTANGLAYLVWREGRAYFVAKGREQPAMPEEVEALRRFSADLAGALG